MVLLQQTQGALTLLAFVGTDLPLQGLQLIQRASDRRLRSDLHGRLSFDSPRLSAAMLPYGRQAQLISLLERQEQAACGKGFELSAPVAPFPLLAELGANSMPAPVRMRIDQLLDS